MHEVYHPCRHRGGLGRTPGGCKPKPQKIPPGIDGAKILPIRGIFGKVSGCTPRQSSIFAPPGAAHQVSFSGKSFLGASAAGCLDGGGIFWGLGLYRPEPPCLQSQGSSARLGSRPRPKRLPSTSPSRAVRKIIRSAMATVNRAPVATRFRNLAVFQSIR